MFSKNRLTALAALTVTSAFVLTACGTDSSPLEDDGATNDASGDDTIVIGSQDYYSNEIIAETYAQALPIKKQGSNYLVEVINPVHYASYVEFGHRQEEGRYVPAIGKTLKQGWVQGKYFLTLSEQDLRKKAPAVIEQELEKLLREVFRV